ncbi:MAG: Hpt domain-containing protein [Candidatus Thiodiazotropha sp.]
MTILEEFLEMPPNCAAVLREACPAGDRTALYQTAHKLEGSASTSDTSSVYGEAATLSVPINHGLSHNARSFST